ncbi:MAG: endopeptidase La [Deltaproteobacteria bacterium]|nr:endopeptidase La [Deltaproteobacteria bacterium]
MSEDIEKRDDFEEETQHKPQQVNFDDIPDIIPLLPVRDVVIYSYMILPLMVGREKSIKAVEQAVSGNRLIFLATQKLSSDEDPTPGDIYSVGTVAMVVKMLKLPDGRVKILVQGVAKGRIVSYLSSANYFMVQIDKIQEPAVEGVTIEIEALMRTVKENSEKILQLRGIVSPDAVAILDSIEDPGRLADLVASNLKLRVEESQQILEIIEPVPRLKKVNELLSKELELSAMQAKIQTQAKEEMGKTHREYFLREQLKAIQSELGEIDEKTKEIEEFRAKIVKAKIPSEVQKEADKQLSRLGQMHPDAAEASIIRTYLDWIVELPWSKATRDKLDIKRAKQILDEDHYDLEKIKDRILEYLGVRKLNKQMKGPILCFVGPPGVGKTSLGKSIARALGRKFTRISLGGLRDEAEIRGHRRTYIGALPGRIIQGLKNAGSNNPVFMFDEIDKVGADFRGDPSAALLEVLDPEQNNAFSDHYLNVPFDLSKVMFITTANLADPIIPALKDRMEIIELAGYIDEEKLKIARQYLIPRQIKENGIKLKDLDFTDEAILNIINVYTREAGLRNLEREIANVCRKIARKIAEGEKKIPRITAKNLSKFLGIPRFLPDHDARKDEIGVATGLAWTPYGGDVLHIEATPMEGKGSLLLTGQLGDVMKESGQAAMSYCRSRAAKFGLIENFYFSKDIHVHVPAGAIPKDGPSAGVTMATALVSALTGIPVRADVAMTGEITLRGRVLPIGGLREKSLAALRARIYTIIAPEQNQKDLGEIPKHIRRRLDFRFVKHMDEVLKIALTEFPAKENIIDADADSKKKPVPKAKKEATSKPDGGVQPSDGK